MHSMTRLRAALLGLVTTLLAGLGLVAAPSANAAVEWIDGSIKYTSVINCPSMIWGTPYYENGIGAYAGHAVDQATDQPKVGEIFYLHVEIWGLGNPCSGTVVQPQFNLPAGVSFAKTAPIQCYVNGAGGNAPNNNCPGWDHMSANGLYSGPDGGQYPGVFPIPQGVEFEIRIPVKASAQMTGTSWSTTLYTADGNSSPTLQLGATMWVFPAAQQPDPKVAYPNPSTRAETTLPGTQTPTRYGLVSEFSAVDLAGRAGRMGFRIGTTQANLAEVAAVDVAAGNATASAWTDWDEPGLVLQPGQTYFWRGTFDPGAAGGGDVVLGQVQSFTVPGGGDPDPEPEKADPRLRAWAADTTVARTKPAVLKASVVAGATGKVTFKNKATGKVLCAATISAGKATCKVAATLKPGKYAVVASYAGDAGFLADRTSFTFTKLRN